MRVEHTSHDNPTPDVPVKSLAYQLRQPLLQIAQYAQSGPGYEKEIDAIATTTTKLLDCYVLSNQPDQLELSMESVSLGSILQDVLHDLTPIARQHECDIRLQCSGASQLVATHKSYARAAFLSLGYSFIEGALTGEVDTRRTITFALRRSALGQTAGVFSNESTLQPRSLAQMRALAGKAAQQCSALSGSSSGIIVADTLFRRLNHRLYASRYHKSPGLAASFVKTQQLQLV